MRLWDHKALGFTALIFWMGILPCAWADNFWEEHAIGWHWYEIPAQTHSRQADNDATSDPIQIMEALHQQVKRALDQAILNPTPDNMQHYIALQNQVSAQASRFAIAWQAALLNRPVLDFSLSHPTNTIGKQVYLNEQKADEDQAARFKVDVEPALFTVDPYRQTMIPVGYGLMSEDALRTRILAIAKQSAQSASDELKP